MSSVNFQDLPDVLKSIRTRPLFVMRLAVQPLVLVGATPAVTRRIGVVSGGRFEGDRLAGEVMDGGSDWQSIRSDGGVGLDVRVVLKTSDDALIAMTYRGIRQGPADVIKRMESGQEVSPDSYYFRMAPTFETASSKYGWLNQILAIGAGHRLPDGPVYSVFEVL
jgi:hypothetical protein